jgi:hypothetical protein
LEELFIEGDDCASDEPEDVLDWGAGLVDYVMVWNLVKRVLSSRTNLK